MLDSDVEGLIRPADTLEYVHKVTLGGPGRLEEAHVSIVRHGDEAGVLLIHDEAHTGSQGVLSLHKNTKIEVSSEQDGGSSCSISSLSDRFDIEHLQLFFRDDCEPFVRLVKHYIGLAQKSNMDGETRSHLWLHFYDQMTSESIVTQVAKISLDDTSMVSTSEDSDSTDVESKVSNDADSNPFLGVETPAEFVSDELIAKHIDRIRKEYLESTWQQHRAEFTHTHTATVHCSTWNMAGRDLVEPLDALLKPSLEDGKIEMYSLAFQEVDVSAEAYLTSADTKAQQYIHAIDAALGDHYELVAWHQLVGILLCVYVHKSIAPTISDLEKSSVSCGLFGMIGNKGGVGIRFKIMDTSFAFVNCHLAAGQSASPRRNTDLDDIFKKLFNEESIWNSGLSGTDNTFLMGDLNYRIDLTRQAVDSALRAQELQSLQRYDQLNRQRGKGAIFVGWHEESITFQPTYKFDMDTDFYDTSDKQRVPSWTDRILTRSHKSRPIEPVPQTYKSHPQYRQSDHKPVSMEFRAVVETVLQDRLKVIERKAQSDLDRWENEATPTIRLKSGEDQLNFGVVHYMSPTVRSIGILNSGKVPARFRFIARHGTKALCKRWVWPLPARGILQPGKAMQIQFMVYADAEDVVALNKGTEQLSDVLILHVEGGKDHYISVQGDWQRTCFGQSLETLSKSQCLRPAQSTSSAAEDEPSGSQIPSIIHRICESLLAHTTTTRLATRKAKRAVLDILQNKLDENRPLECDGYTRSDLDDALFDLLVGILATLSDPVVPEDLVRQVQDSVASSSTLVLERMNHLQANVLIYLIGFISGLVELHTEDSDLEDRLCCFMAPALIRPDSNMNPTSKASRSTIESARHTVTSDAMEFSTKVVFLKSLLHGD